MAKSVRMPTDMPAAASKPWPDVPRPSERWTHLDTAMSIGSALVVCACAAYLGAWLLLAPLVVYIGWNTYEMLRAWAAADDAHYQLVAQRDQAARIARRYWPEFRSGQPVTPKGRNR